MTSLRQVFQQCRAHRHVSWAVLVGVLCYAVPAHAQLAPNEYVHTSWSMEDGLPQNSIYAIAQTPDGYLWLGTLNGLVRFDGVRFTTFTPSDTPGLVSNRIRELHVTPDGALWVGGNYGLTRYLQKEFVPVLSDAHVPVPTIGTGKLYQTQQGDIWTITPSALHHVTGDTVYSYTTLDGLPSLIIHDLAEDKEGRLWVSTDRGKAYFDGTHWIPDTPSSSLAHATDASGIRWYTATSGGLYRYTAAGDTTVYTSDDLDGLWTVLVDPEGTTWAMKRRRGLFHVTEEQLIPFELEVLLDTPTSLFVDREGLIWIGTNGKGLHRLRRRTIRAYTTKDGLPHYQIHAVFEDDERTIWGSAYRGNVFRIKDDDIRAYTHTDGLEGVAVHTLGETADGRLWVGEHAGLTVFNGQRFVVPDDLAPSCRGIEGGLAAYRLNDGSTLIGTQYGDVYRMADHTCTVVLTRAQVNHLPIRALIQAPDNSLWIGTPAGLFHVVDDDIRTYNDLHGLSIASIRALFFADSTTLWVGTYGGGLCALQNERFTCLTPKAGLPEATVHTILEDDYGYIWLSSNGGIFRARRAALEAFFMGQSTHVYFDSFGPDDGMPSRETNGGFQPAVWEASDGRLWYPTTGGLAVVDPAQIDATHEQQVAVHIERLVVDGIPWDFTAALPAGSRRMVLDYTATHLAAPSRLRFRYRLIGYDDAWIEGGSLRQAQYMNLPPDTYTFEVQAAVGSGPWTSMTAQQTFTLKPYVWQTGWFWSLSALLALCAFLGTYGWRMRHLRQREAALQALIHERTQDLVAAKQQSEAQAARLQTLDHLKTTFIVNASHELRTPLTLTLGPLTDALTHPLPEPVAQSLDAAHRNAQRLHHLIDELLEAARLETGHTPLQLAPHDWVTLVRDSVDTHRWLAEQAHLTLVFMAEQPSVWVLCDAEKIRKVISNLITNAVKFTPEGGEVIVHVEHTDDEAFLIVGDTGIGMTPDIRDQIFDRFYQASDTSWRGLGVGLALTKDIVELHQGRIDVRSEPGIGSTFRVALPLHPTPPAAAESFYAFAATQGDGQPHPTPLSEAPLSAEKLTILLIEDHADIRAYVRQQLQSFYQILEAETGEAGIALAQAQQLALIICDVMLPDQDGFSVCQHLKANPATQTIPFVLLTARARAEDKHEGLACGADDYIVKPFDPVELRLRVANLIRARQHWQTAFSEQVVVQPARITVSSNDASFLDQVLKVLETHHRDSAFTIDAFATELHLSPRQLRRKVRALTDETPSALLRRYRLERAQHLLESQAGTVAEVAYHVGFKDPFYFSRCFHEAFGCAPSAWPPSE